MHKEFLLKEQIPVRGDFTLRKEAKRRSPVPAVWIHISTKYDDCSSIICKI